MVPRFWRTIVSTWYRSRISHRSEYSVERLLSFRDYLQRTSSARVLAVCAISPIPALLVTLAIDCIPLKPPSDGWRANYAVWIRQTVAMFFEALGVVLQVREVILTGTISNTNAVGIALGTAVSCVLATIVVADAWIFPIPFGYVLLLNLYVLLFSICMIVGIGPRVLANSSLLRQQIKSQLFIIANQGIVAVCYPIFSAVFNRLSATQQEVFIFVMPIIKFFTKQNIANAAASSHEYIGPIVVFSVDLFNVYYVAICMQSAKSITTTLIIIAIDSIYVFFAIRTIYKRVNPLQGNNEFSKDGYVQHLLGLLRKVRQEEHFSRPSVATKSVAHEPKVISQPNVTKSPATQLSTTLPSKSSEDIVYDALQTLFHSEYILLAKYIKFVIPILYSLYLMVLYHLPIAMYYPHTASLTFQDLMRTVDTILVYAAIEMLSFLLLLVLLWHKFGFSPLYQLAFVLETQAPALQGYLFVWTITILHLTLAHYVSRGALGGSEVFRFDSCQAVFDRDVNAARNIFHKNMALLL
ncbi:hypothetical protein PHMEG_00015067 [Phytophthora megakarya]|uniref:Transmembrane protein n=1 Tax=Phytophthora megakarya TaxID=4795 RepID=A0A225W3S0_9STRA|nr:hypothetical protein PHMEG_00015067 [Phytophthora megakarya]